MTEEFKPLATVKPIDVEALKALVRTVPDFPKPGILFYDITTLLKDKTGFARLIDALAAHYIARKIDLVLGIEARGFIFGPALAYRLNAGFVPVRKPRKLPAPVARVTYDLEYGSDTLEIHLDAIAPNQKVVLVDDLLATGGTMEATTTSRGAYSGSTIAVPRSHSPQVPFSSRRRRPSQPHKGHENCGTALTGSGKTLFGGRRGGNPRFMPQKSMRS
jgi:adenine phosphoribosyltransferase